MKLTAITKLLLPATALTGAALLLVPVEPAVAYSTLGSNLPHTQRDFRIHNNFADAVSNNNNTPDANFPGYGGCFMAFWKGAAEWASELQGGNGDGDPHQNGSLGSGGANFDAFMGGESSSIGGTTHNIVSAVSSCSSGVLAYCESTGLGGAGWRIRFCESWSWDDGPGTSIGNRMDIQGVACHEYDHALGLGHSTVGSATMYPSASGNGVPGRSIANDDVAGVQFIYGVRSASKPKITGAVSTAGSITITGSGFTNTGNQVWFTPLASSSAGGAPKIVVTDVTSDGTTITVGVPVEAGPGNVMVKTSGNDHNDMSNAWPTGLSGGTGGGGCDSPTNYCSSTPNSGSPFGAVMGFSGTASYSANDLVLECYGAVPNQFGVFYYGPSQISASFGNGIRCVGAGFLGTFRLPVIQTDSFGDASLALDYGQAPMNAGNGIIVDGMEYNFQFWFRDPPAGGANFNLSDGLHVTFCP